MRMQEGCSCTLAEAATAVGRAESTIRFWIQKKLVTGQKSKNGGWVIDRNSLLAHAAAAEPLRPQRPIHGATSSAAAPRNEEQLLDALRAQITTLSQALDYERRGAEDVRKQNRELQGQLVKLAAEIQALLSRETDGKLSRWFRR
jgi:hypothetical protein